jgi:hypothetical protein
VSFFKPKFVLLALTGTLLPAVWTSGCSGDAFRAGVGSADAGATSTGGSNASGGTNNGTSGSGAEGGGTRESCDGPEDCDDENICTTDRCNADGTCDASPKCGGADKCCSGECQQCCDSADCDDDVSCTTNTCFAGQCMFVPDDGKCAVTEYCAANDGCKPRQICTGLPGESVSVCDDKASCTSDTCEGGLCQHKFCDANSVAKLCCEGVGCAECCNDSQCEKDKDPCTVGACQGGKCSEVPLCGKGQECCASADGTTATCGACCSAAQCDDRIGCTLDKCTGNQCSNTPDKCPAGYVCDVMQKGCVKHECTVNTDCNPSPCQSNGRCEAGACHFDGCAVGTTCCANGSGCAACCSDAGCNDSIACTKDACGAAGCTHTPDNTQCPPGYLCNALNGCVSGCKVDGDCDLRVITAAIPIGTNPCSVPKCVNGQCQDSTVTCAGTQTCCPATGSCTLPSQCLQTQ